MRFRLSFGLGVAIVAAVVGATAFAGSRNVAVTQADCSPATALRLVEQHQLNDFGLSRPVQQVLCGPFTGPGSEAMAIAIAAPTCWGIQRWAVFRFTSGAWQLVLDQREFVFLPLVGVGGDIRVTTPIFRRGDPRCLPSGGKHARTWHWNGTHFVPGPYRRVGAAPAVTSAAFHMPSGNIECGMVDQGKYALVDCWSFKPPQRVKLYPSGRLTICRGGQARCQIGNVGEAPTLAYGRSLTVGRFRCTSLESAVRCTVIRSGKGFLLNRSGVTKTGPGAATATLGGQAAPTVFPPAFSQIVTGYRHTCAITRAGGRVMCWGDNSWGEIGDGTRKHRRYPHYVVGLSGVRAISAGGGQTCAVTSAGGLTCWGDVEGHGLYGGESFFPTPVEMAGLASGVSAVAAGGHHTCALLNTGAARCWGMEYRRDRIPRNIPGASGLRTISSGSGGASCGITNAGAVMCWAGFSPPPRVVTLPGGVKALTLGSTPNDGVPGQGGAYDTHTCWLTSAGGVKCSGGNALRELGTGKTDPYGSTRSAVDVVGLTSGVAAVDAGSAYTCALTSAGGVKCWGFGVYGQLGNGKSPRAQATPVDVLGLQSGVSAVSASGHYHTCALTTAGRAKCWGYNGAGQLGNGRIRRSSRPVDVVMRPR